MNRCLSHFSMIIGPTIKLSKHSPLAGTQVASQQDERLFIATFHEEHPVQMFPWSRNIYAQILKGPQLGSKSVLRWSLYGGVGVAVSRLEPRKEQG